MFRRTHDDDFVDELVEQVTKISLAKNFEYVENMCDNNNQNKHHKNYDEEQVHNWQTSVDLHR